MSNIRLPKALCAAVAEVLHGSHPTLDEMFLAAGAPGPAPELPHSTKWKTWLFRSGNDPSVDSLALLGNLIEEFMDLPPQPGGPTVASLFGVEQDPVAQYAQRRERLSAILEEHGFRYFRGGRVIPIGDSSQVPENISSLTLPAEPERPSKVEDLIQTLIQGLPRAMHPLAHRRKGANSLTFESEYDIQDLLHSQLRPWIADIRAEEFTPSYAGSSTRMDFLLPKHGLVIETKLIRDKVHGKKIGDELIIDIEHYRRHTQCDRLWCVIYDPLRLIPNPSGLISDLEGRRNTPDGEVTVRLFVF